MAPGHDVTTYLAIGQLGRAFRAIGLAEGDRETIVRNLISGQYLNALRVVALNTAEGWSRDVAEDIPLRSWIAHLRLTRRLPMAPSASSTATST
jgi:hypothetical protein